MGYIYRLTGTIRIDPPLSWAEIKSTPFTEYQGFDIRLAVDSEEVETADGTLVRRTASRVIAERDEPRAYDLVKRLQAMVDAFPGHTWEGYIQGDGEDAGDQWRLWVNPEGRAAQARPVITWPEGVR